MTIQLPRSYRLFFFILLFFQCNTTLMAQEDKCVKTVKQILDKQSQAWNKGDIPTFMETYWKSDNLQFIGSSGVTYGWQNTLEGYQKRYPNKEAMGKLSFDIINVDKRSKKVISLVGKFKLSRTIGDLSGHFLLLFKKIKGKWLIIADHTSVEC